jgi:hypothetical protein
MREALRGKHPQVIARKISEYITSEVQRQAEEN